jgi:hypothetical protein
MCPRFAAAAYSSTLAPSGTLGGAYTDVSIALSRSSGYVANRDPSASFF